jgi:methionine biosynthesis protein MetW
VKTLDYLLQRGRIAKAAQFIERGARVLDVGCADGALFRVLRRASRAVWASIPIWRQTRGDRTIRLVRGLFPDDLRTMALHQHQGFGAGQTPERFPSSDFALEHRLKISAGPE